MDYELLIKEHGTPTYLYDIETLINRMNYLKVNLMIEFIWFMQ